MKSNIKITGISKKADMLGVEQRRYLSTLINTKAELLTSVDMVRTKDGWLVDVGYLSVRVLNLLS